MSPAPVAAAPSVSSRPQQPHQQPDSSHTQAPHTSHSRKEWNHPIHLGEGCLPGLSKNPPEAKENERQPENEENSDSSAHISYSLKRALAGLVIRKRRERNSDRTHRDQNTFSRSLDTQGVSRVRFTNAAYRFDALKQSQSLWIAPPWPASPSHDLPRHIAGNMIRESEPGSAGGSGPCSGRSTRS